MTFLAFGNQDIWNITRIPGYMKYMKMFLLMKSYITMQCNHSPVSKKVGKDVSVKIA